VQLVTGWTLFYTVWNIRRFRQPDTGDFVGASRSKEQAGLEYQLSEQRRVREVSTMIRSVPVEEESGTFTGHVHTHNGYYAGDFGSE
jgi:hypothetical protein